MAEDTRRKPTRSTSVEGMPPGHARLGGQTPSVLHVNDCAYVAETLCDEAARQGLPWRRYRPTPAGANPVLTAGYRAGELARFKAVAGSYDLLHVHYGLLSYYAMAAAKPFVLHLHGTDIRTAIDQNPVYRYLLRWGLRHASLVYFSTPDLAVATRRHRPDAQWLPAPVRAAEPAESAADPTLEVTNREVCVLFGSRWDDVKGAAELRAIGSRLRALRPGTRLIGVDWGTEAGHARMAGVEMLPVMPHFAFRHLLAKADLVIGQMRCGVPGMTELEALAAGTPVLMHLDSGNPYGCAPPVVDTDAESAPRVIVELLEDVSRRARLHREGPEWVQRFHAVESTVTRLAADYAGVVDMSGTSRQPEDHRIKGGAGRSVR